MNPFRNFKRDRYINSGGNTATVSVGSNGTIVTTNYVNAEAALKNSDIFAVVTKIAGDIASCDFQVIKQFKKILLSPNGLISGFNFWQSVISQLLLAGNAYVIIVRGKNNAIGHLEYVSPAQVQINLSDDSQRMYYTVNWNDNRGAQVYAWYDVLHFRLMSPWGNDSGDYLTGVSPLYSLQHDLQIQEQSKQLTLSTLKNAINPSSVITLPEAQVDKKSKDAVRDSFIEQNSGENGGKVVVLDQSAKLDKIVIDTNVANFLSNYDFSQAQITKAFGIPQSILDDKKGDQQSNIGEIMNFYASSLMQYVKPIESELTLKLKTEVTLNIANAVDLTHQNLITNIVALGAGRTPVLAATQAQQILIDNGVFNMKIQEPAEGGM
ncbi:phage portal protein [Liquorilactobacillus hordei]|uniref:phage portal protein n=1 Tax=Liquorilactobacillus hordei TaxID=468911 RepID=UPI0039E8A330